MAIVFQATGIDMAELTTGKSITIGKIRKNGGGRKKLENIHEDLLSQIEKLVAPETRGYPLLVY